MKRFYNQTDRKIEEIENGYEAYVYELDIPGTYGLPYYKKLDESIANFFKGIKNSEKPTLFIIQGDFNLLEKLKEEDREYFIITVINIFASHLITNKRLPGEFRLSPPKNLSEMKLNTLVRKDLVNKKLKFPIFSMEVQGKDSDFLYEVM